MLIRPQTETDYPAQVELLNTVFGEVLTVEEYARQQASRPADRPYLVLVAEVDGQVVARGAAGIDPRLPDGDMGFYIAVAPAMRGRGIGTALHSQLLEFCRTHRPARLRASMGDQSAEALAWVERRGFSRMFYILESHLDLAAFDPAPLADRVESVKARGIRLLSFSQLRSRQNEPRLWRLYMGLLKDTPDGSEWRETPQDDWLQWAFREPAAWPEGWLLAVTPDGDWAGLTFMQKYLDGSGMAHIYMTGVKREYRGLGIATALKVEGARLAKEQGITRLSTINETENLPILAANQRLGFTRVSGFYRLVRPFTEG